MFNKYLKIFWSGLASSLLCGFFLSEKNSEKSLAFVNVTIIMCVMWVVTRIISEGIYAIIPNKDENEKKDI